MECGVMDAKEIMQRYKHLSLLHLEELEFNEDGESLSVLYENTWLRILLVRMKETPDRFSIDVEFSMPSAEESDNNKAAEVLSLSLKYLEYIQNLTRSGFSLEVIGQDWLWIASKSFAENPDLSLFEQLVPPLH